jgi:hypothetical protein
LRGGYEAITPFNLSHPSARLVRAGQVITAIRTDSHTFPIGMIDMEDVADTGSAFLTRTDQIAKILLADQMPTRPWPN